MKMHIKPIAVIILLSLVLLFFGCKNMSKTTSGTAVGAGAGAAAGALIGKALGETVKGTLIGAVVGGAAGNIIGNQMDKQAEELEKNLQNAEIERVGEGIAITFESGLLFAFDSSEIQPAARQNLTQLANSLKEYPDSKVLIVGHTDSSGSEEYNLELSNRRSQSAKTFLVSRGLDSNRIESQGRGESEPIADNATETGRDLNRRVEVAIFASEEYVELIQAQNQ
jgi:outer membrane protein OmpA-like peptidoglycan-associated protein